MNHYSENHFQKGKSTQRTGLNAFQFANLRNRLIDDHLIGLRNSSGTFIETRKVKNWTFLLDPGQIIWPGWVCRCFQRFIDIVWKLIIQKALFSEKFSQRTCSPPLNHQRPEYSFEKQTFYSKNANLLSEAEIIWKMGMQFRESN